MCKTKTNIPHGGAAAFTLIEIVVVVVILAVAALIAVPMMSSAADMQVRAAANRLAADLEYAKNMAITHQQPYTVTFNKNATTANGYELRDASNTLIKHPVSLRDFEVRFASEHGISRVRVINADFVGADASTSESVTFDYLGTPFSGTDETSALNSGLVTLRDTAGNFTLYVRVEPMTGYVAIASTP